MGYTGGEDGVYHVVKIGTQKYEAEGYKIHIYKMALPSVNDYPDIFTDDFADGEEIEGEWLRPGRGEGLADDVQVLSLFSSANPVDLGQGALSDCWLISAFAAMAEYPEALMNIFDQKTIALDGKYSVNLYSFEQQCLVKVVVDDRIPASEGAALCAQISQDGELWPCILEKAFAAYTKPVDGEEGGDGLLGGYKGMDGGHACFAMAVMTGCTDLEVFCREDGTYGLYNPKWTVDNSQAIDYGELMKSRSDEEMLQLLNEYDNLSYLMCCGSADGSDRTKNSKGIVQGHAYTLLRVELNVADSGIDLVQARNPWGESEWTGRWSDSSELWDAHPEVKAALQHVAEEDGMFWMEWRDFVQNYPEIVICKQTMGKNRSKLASVQRADSRKDVLPKNAKGYKAKKAKM